MEQEIYIEQEIKDFTIYYDVVVNKHLYVKSTYKEAFDFIKEAMDITNEKKVIKSLSLNERKIKHLVSDTQGEAFVAAVVQYYKEGKVQFDVMKSYVMSKYNKLFNDIIEDMMINPLKYIDGDYGNVINDCACLVINYGNPGQWPIRERLKALSNMRTFMGYDTNDLYEYCEKAGWLKAENNEEKLLFEETKKKMTEEEAKAKILEQ